MLSDSDQMVLQNETAGDFEFLRGICYPAFEIQSHYYHILP
jgi:hypothetical protein